jgi:Family of unknown function (DUF5681)
MAWQKGQSGNPSGYAIATGKPFSDALRLALNRAHGKHGQRRLNLIAECLAKAAANGEPWAIKEVADRLDGRPAQSIEAKVDLISSMSDDQLERELRAALAGLGWTSAAAGSSRPN